MVARADRVGDPFPNEQRADRQAVAEPLRERHEVRLDAELLVGEERSGAAEPGLYLVDAEKCSDLAGDLGRCLDEALLQRQHAALAQHRLEQDRRELAARRDRCLERLDVVRPREREPRDERPEALPLPGLAGGGEGAVGAAVEASLERDDPRAPGRLARDLERRLVRLRARVAEERLRTAETLGEEPGEAEHRLRPVEVRRVPEPVELRVRRLGDGGMTVPEPDDRDPGAEVEVRAALVVPHAAPLAADDGQVGARVGRQHGGARAT